MTDQTREQMQCDIRYAVVLHDRSARLYRRVQTVGTFITLLGGSAFIAAQSDLIKPLGFAVAAVTGIAMLAIKPVEKAVAHESDSRRYRALMAQSHAMPLDELRQAITQARIADTQEIEPLRNVAYNQVVTESGRTDHLLPLTFSQRLLAGLA